MVLGMGERGKCGTVYAAVAKVSACLLYMLELTFRSRGRRRRYNRGEPPLLLGASTPSVASSLPGIGTLRISSLQ